MNRLLALSGPDRKSDGDFLSQLLDEELESEVLLARRLSSSPPQVLHLTHSLTPVRKRHRPPAAQDASCLKPSSVVLNRLASPSSSIRDASSR